MIPGAAPGLLGWIQTYGAYVQFITQIAFWLVLMAVAIYAVLLFRKLVNAKVAAIGAGMPTTPVEAERAVSVDEFVE